MAIKLNDSNSDALLQMEEGGAAVELRALQNSELLSSLKNGAVFNFVDAHSTRRVTSLHRGQPSISGPINRVSMVFGLWIFRVRSIYKKSSCSRTPYNVSQ
jgi:hypothetical protein